ncbi:SCP2 sterol-binding domain-containing protein [Janibacter sp. DB-40]|uniref:SCP2 sterol-binding domain-containing protein n=1 Tax=Janibacter sp. DB-40 TaxID=3028808 RepID=UPI00240569C2|nr:SCP2 sterol-binding domain-containing protein [Janibacter sp. DB-40]
MELDPSSFATTSPEEFAALVKGMSDREIAETMRGEHRSAVLDAVFARFPTRFRPDRAEGVSATTQFRITGGPESRPHDTYEIVIDDGSCRVSEEPGDDFDVSLMMAPAEFLKMTTGRGNPTMMVMRGKIKVKGDLALAATFPSMFDTPKA